MRLLLGEGNYVIVDGEKINLDTPSAQSSGLKVKMDAVIMPETAYTFVIDFDADKSLVKAGNSGKYNLKPKLTGWVEAATGAIQGTFSPMDAVEYTYVLVGTDTLGAYPNNSGYFRISGLSTGTYDLNIKKPETDSIFTWPNPVVVTAGSIHSMGKLVIQ
jgi:hypothetical protein